MTGQTIARVVAGLAGMAALLGSGPARALGPITKGPWVQRVTADSAVVRLEVDPPAAVTLDLGAIAGDAGIVVSPDTRALHTIPLTGLRPGTRYGYTVKVGATSKVGSFVTAPAPDDRDATFKFLVYGDNRTDDAAHAVIVRAMTPAPSDFLVHTGDFVGRGENPAHWQTFFDIEGPLLGGRCLFSAVGNHELTDGAGIEYVKYFGPTDPPGGIPPGKNPVITKPEHLDGTFRWGNARLFLLNGMVSYKNTVDRAWLEKALSDADREPGLVWRIVVTHHGPWSSGPHGNNARLHDAGVVALLKEHKVDLVVSGHDHIYERGSADIAYIVSGGGGAPLYKIKTKLPQARKVESAHHFVEVSVNANALGVHALRADGSTIERCGLRPNGGGWDCDGGETASAVASGEVKGGSSGGAGPTSAPSASSPSRCTCDAIGASRTAGSTGAAGALAVLAIATARRSLARRLRASILG